MNINVIGTRGFPNIQGGVEKHCEALYPRISSRGCSVTVFRRKPYINNLNAKRYHEGVMFSDIFTLNNRYLETIIHSLLAAFVCVLKRPDIVHVHNIGPSLILPILKVFRIKAVVTYHSANYEHKKWGWIAQKLLKIGECFTLKFADMVIFISRSKYIEHKINNKRFLVNGVSIPKKTNRKDFIKLLNLEPGKYILTVSRLSPEKGLDLLINAFKKTAIEYSLVIAGGSDNQDKYEEELRLSAIEDDRIQFTGYINGNELNEIYSHASYFVLPSYNEGLPIAVLEAMGYGLPILVSDIQPNKDLELAPQCYFKNGDMNELSTKLDDIGQGRLKQDKSKYLQRVVREKYDWSTVADKTIEIYSDVIGC